MSSDCVKESVCVCMCVCVCVRERERGAKIGFSLGRSSSTFQGEGEE